MVNHLFHPLQDIPLKSKILRVASQENDYHIEILNKL